MDTSFSLSLELIYLMNWLLKHEKEKLKEIIEISLKNGLLEEINKLDTEEEVETDSENIHSIILDFLIYLEDALSDSLKIKDPETEKLEKIDLKSELRKINSNKIASHVISASVQQAKSLFLKEVKEKNLSKPEIKNVLHSQLIKNWDPDKNDPIN